MLNQSNNNIGSDAGIKLGNTISKLTKLQFLNINIR